MLVKSLNLYVTVCATEQAAAAAGAAAAVQPGSQQDPWIELWHRRVCEVSCSFLTDSTHVALSGFR